MSLYHLTNYRKHVKKKIISKKCVGLLSMDFNWRTNIAKIEVIYPKKDDEASANIQKKHV